MHQTVQKRCCTEGTSFCHQSVEHVPQNRRRGHRSDRGHLSSYHSVFWRIFNLLKKESLLPVSILQHLSGHEPPPPRPRYLDCNLPISRTADDFPNCQIVFYLKSIAHNLGFLMFYYSQKKIRFSNLTL